MARLNGRSFGTPPSLQSTTLKIFVSSLDSVASPILASPSRVPTVLT